MFHGIVKSAKGYWFRLITSAALLDGETVIEEFRPGPYQAAFLNIFFPGKYRVEVRKVKQRKMRGINSESPAVHDQLFSSEVIRWSTASDQYMVRIKGNQGWLSSFKEIGLIIRNSKKMSKRLVEIVRTASMWVHVPDGSLKLEVIKHSYPDCYVDGISFISRRLALRCIRSNTDASRRWRAKQIWRIHSGKTAIVSFRMLCSDGLIKGNALVLPGRMMNGYDVRTFDPNIKSEIRTTGWQWVTIEPSYGAIPVKSDDLTHAIYRGVSGLYDDQTLLESLDGMLKTFFADLKEGKRSEWLTRLVDSEQVLHEDVESRFSSDRGLVGLIQEKVAELDKLGVPLTASQTLMFLSVNGLKQQVLGNADKGRVWMDKTRHWFPVPWAYAAHIMTKEVLELAGFKMPKGEFGLFHEATHSFVVPGAFFQKHLPDHGGPDLDDTVKVHIRTIGDTMVAFLLRNPNDFGEWSVIPVNEPGPVFHAYTDQPPVVDWEELFNTVPQFSWMMDQLTIGSLPGGKNLTIGDEFSLEDERRVRTAAELFPAGTGGAVLPKMVYAACVGGYLPEYKASNEDIIDALQQGMATPEDIMIIKDFADYIFAQLRNKTNGVVDAFWYHTRLYDELALMHGLTAGDVEASPWVALHRQRELMTRKALEEMTFWLNANITKPDILASIRWTPEEIRDAPNELAKVKAGKSRSADWVQEFVKLLEESDAEFGEERTNRKILRLANEAFNAKAQWPRANHDQWLYSLAAKSEKQPLDWFIRALKAEQSKTNR
jgi:hypothetical protein